MRRSAKLTNFRGQVLDYYERHGRHDLPWRIPDPDGSFNPYMILVSEIMLQQTQVSRVIPKYIAFMDSFPTVQSLAQAPLAAILTSWSGLGYNRRAKFLYEAAKQVDLQYNDIFPDELSALVRLPGVGVNTAGAILAYAFNRPVVFIETNIRTVYIHHFFKDKVGVSDAEIHELVSATLDAHDPRQWYWAIMDYGSFLKKSVGNVNTASKSYSKQSPFEGSKRKIRGQVIQLLTTKRYSEHDLSVLVGDGRLAVVLDDLEAEGLIRKAGQLYHL